MSVLEEVVDTVRNMGFAQLLLAFVACFGYALAQGGLLSGKGRRIAWAIAFVGAAGFAVASPDWPDAVMLIALAVVAIGSLAAVVWVVSRMVGVDRSAGMLPLTDSLFSPSGPISLTDSQSTSSTATAKDRRDLADGSVVSA